MKRKVDAARQAQRRDRQHGESDEQYRERIRKRLEQETGLAVTITEARPVGPVGGKSFLILGHSPGAGESRSPVVRVNRGSLSTAASTFAESAARLASIPRRRT